MYVYIYICILKTYIYICKVINTYSTYIIFYDFTNITLHYITLHYITTLLYIALHYITLLPYMNIYIYTFCEPTSLQSNQIDVYNHVPAGNQENLVVAHSGSGEP